MISSGAPPSTPLASNQAWCRNWRHCAPKPVCKVALGSAIGAAVAAEARPPIGSEVMLGKLRGKVVRHHDDGIGIEFMDLQNAEAVRRYFGPVER